MDSDRLRHEIEAVNKSAESIGEQKTLSGTIRALVSTIYHVCKGVVFLRMIERSVRKNTYDDTFVHPCDTCGRTMDSVWMRCANCGGHGPSIK